MAQVNENKQLSTQFYWSPNILDNKCSILCTSTVYIHRAICEFVYAHSPDILNYTHTTCNNLPCN